MQKLFKILLVIPVCVFVLSCEHESDSSDDHYESLVVEYNFAQSKYELVSRSLYSLDKPRELDSKVAKFFYKTASNVLLEYETPLTLNLIKTSDNLYVPKDLSSLKSISSYKIYENYYNLHNKLDILAYSKWPKKVVVDGVDGEVGKNNAFHLPTRTSTFYLPFDPNNVPANLNPGVVAHEENHGLFFTQVVEGRIKEDLYVANSAILQINYWDRSKNSNGHPGRCLRNFTCGNFKSLFNHQDVGFVGKNSAQFNDVVDVMEYNHVLLKAIDEGLADYAGFVFTKVPDYLLATLEFERAGRSGDFDRVVGSSLLEPLPSIDQLQAVIDGVKGKSNAMANSIPIRYKNLSRRSQNLITLSYRIAGQMSSLLNILSQNINYKDMPANLSKEEYFYKLLTNSLGNMKKVVGSSYKNKQMSFNDFFTAVMDEKYITEDTCRILKKEVSDTLTVKGCTDD